MISFKQFLSENPTYKNQFIKNKNSDFTKVICDSINERYKLYRYDITEFYLTDIYDNYVCSINGCLIQDTLHIIANDINEESIYNMICENIIQYTNIKEIINDNNLSVFNKKIDFKTFLSEMAYDNHITTTSSRENEFTDNISSPFMKLVKKGINSEHYNLYRYGTGTFYLSGENNNYLGIIEGDYENNNGNHKLYIKMSHSNIKGGFYNLMFTSILGLTDIEEIISDDSLSPTAFKSYENLYNRSQLNVRILSDNTYLPFSKENAFSKSSNRMSVVESKDFDIREKFQRSFTTPSIYKLYIEKNEIFNNRIYCESKVY